MAQELWPGINQAGPCPCQMEIAKVIVLHKAKKDPSLPKAYRPISLLSTIGKALEAVIATRISHLVEKHYLLQPTILERGAGGPVNKP
jgi:hypothetical protein